MPKLYEITDAFSPEETVDSLPIEPVLPTERPRVIINTAEFDKPKPDPLWDNVEGFKKTVKDSATGIADAIKYASELDQKFTSNILNLPKRAYENSENLKKGLKNLLGLGEEERYQLWPEKVVREALTSAGDIAKPNPYPEGSEQWQFYESKRQEGMVPAAMAISSLAGSGGLAGTGAKAGEVALGATPFLRPALKHKDKLYKGKPGQEHQDIIPKELYEDFRQKAMSGEDLAEYNFGFINDKGHFLDREKALKYGIDTGLIDPHSGRFGALTTTLMADSSKPGMAIEATAKANPFYSAVEHTVKNITQEKMTGEQWLGTLANKPGVKGEELDWIGLKDFLQENKGKPVTKAQIEEHIAANKVELKEVNKGGITERDKVAPDQIAQDKYKAEWDAKVAELRPLREKVDDLERKLSPQEWEKAKNDYFFKSQELDAIHDRMVNETIERLGGLNKPTKYKDYQLPGGENYREILLTLPPSKEVWDQNLIYYMRKYPQVTSEIKTLEDVALAQKHNPAFRETSKGLSPEEILATARASEKPEAASYKSSHWDEPNILAHVRMNDRNIDGKKSLHLEEIQSDWHQQGRDRGYKQGVQEIKGFKPDELKLEKGQYDWSGVSPDGRSAKVGQGVAKTEQEARDYLTRHLNKLASEQNSAARIAESDKLPDAPFKKTWHELALKRMIREAAEKGYDRLSWTPGEAQIARYDLSKQVDRVLWSPEGQKFMAFDKKGNVVIEQKATAQELPNIIGKEAADKLINKPTKINDLGKAKQHVLENADLKIGGEGKKVLYDQIIPKALEKLGKEHGVKVQKGEIDTGKRTKSGMSGKSNPIKEPIFYIDIPQSLKDVSLRKGFPLFSSTPGYMFVPFDGDPFKDNNK